MKQTERVALTAQTVRRVLEIAAKHCEDRGGPEWLSDDNDMLETDRAACIMCARGIRQMDAVKIARKVRDETKNL